MRVTVVLPVLAPKGVSNTAPSAGKVSMVILAGSPPIFSLNARSLKYGPAAFSLVVVNFREADEVCLSRGWDGRPGGNAFGELGAQRDQLLVVLSNFGSK